MRGFQIVANHYALAEGHSKLALYTGIVYTVAIGIVLYPMMKLFGVYGVVVTEVFGVTCNAASFAVFMWKGYRSDMKTAFTWAISSFFACGIAMIPVFMFRSWEWNWVISFPATALYLVLAFAFRLTSIDDVHRLVQALREKFAGGATPAAEKQSA